MRSWSIYFSFCYLVFHNIQVANAFHIILPSTAIPTRKIWNQDNDHCHVFVKNNNDVLLQASSTIQLLLSSQPSTRIKNALFSTNINNDLSIKNVDDSEEQLRQTVLLPSLPRDIVGVIFDMDGTLIQPCIDFADMRNRIYKIADSDPALQSLPLESRRGDVLELYKSFSDVAKTKAKAVFDDIETKAIQDMTLMEHLGELCHYLDGRGIQRAVLTRNVQRSVDAMHKKLWDAHAVKEFYPAVSRETMSLDKEERPLPSKPSPEPIFHICNIWGCSPEQVIMVGDSVADDIVAASRANCGGRILLMYNGKALDNDAGGGNVETGKEQHHDERKPSMVIYNLAQLLEAFQNESTVSQ